ncbi:MAG: PAS domain S-box protein, partial [Chitinophagaceae bacterium]
DRGFAVRDEAGKVIRMVGAMNDISAQKKSEHILRDSEQQLRLALRGGDLGLWDWNASSGKMLVNEEWLTMLGLDPVAVTPSIDLWHSLVHPEDMPKIQQAVEEVILNPRGTDVELEIRAKHADGNYRWILDKGAVVARAEDGSPIRVIGTHMDITKRKENEFALQQSESRQRGIIASQTNYVIRTNLQGEYTYCNPKFIEDFGWLHNHTDLIGSDGLKSIMEYHHQDVKNIVAQCLAKTNHVFKIEIDKPTYDGEIKTTIWDFICLTDTSGQPTEIQCVGIDISDRKKAETAYLNTLREKNTILESIGDAFFAVDQNWMVGYWNNQAEKLLRTPRNSIVGKPLWEIFAGSIGSKSYLKYTEALNTGKVVHFEDYPPLDKWFDVNAYPSSSGLSVYFVDVTERKLAETKLKESELHYRSLIEQAIDAIYITDPFMKFTEVNPSGCLLLNYTREEFLQLDITDILFEANEVDKPFDVSELIEKKQIWYEGALKKKDGSVVEVELSGKMLENGSFIFFARAIGERKTAERLITFRAQLLNTIGQAVMATDLNGHLIFWNKAAELTFGWTSEEALGRTVRDLLPAQNATGEMPDDIMHLNKGSSWSGEFLVKRKDGHNFPIYITNAPTLDQNSLLSGIIGVSTDIAERKRTEYQLQMNQQQLAVIYNTVADIIFLISVEVGGRFKFISVNHAFLSATGLSADQIEGQYADNVIPATSWDFVRSNYLKAIELNKTIRWEEESEYPSGIKTGLVSLTPVLDDKGTAISLVGSVHDISDIKKAEQELKTSNKELHTLSAHLQNIREEERMQIARDIHDELGQQLTGLKMEISLLVKKLNVREETMQQKTASIINLIDDTVKSVRKISSNLRPSLLDDLGLIAALEWYSEEVEERSGLQVDFRSATPEPILSASTATALFRIYQEVLTNTMRHAKASHVTGVLRINNNCLILEVKDDGQGMDLSKAESSKTLGLLGIKERTFLLGGKYELMSNVGQGTEIRISIPLRSINNLC